MSERTKMVSSVQKIVEEHEEQIRVCDVMIKSKQRTRALLGIGAEEVLDITVKLRRDDDDGTISKHSFKEVIEVCEGVKDIANNLLFEQISALEFSKKEAQRAIYEIMRDIEKHL